MSPTEQGLCPQPSQPSGNLGGIFGVFFGKSTAQRLLLGRDLQPVDEECETGRGQPRPWAAQNGVSCEDSRHCDVHGVARHAVDAVPDESSRAVDVDRIGRNPRTVEAHRRTEKECQARQSKRQGKRPLPASWAGRCSRQKGLCRQAAHHEEHRRDSGHRCVFRLWAIRYRRHTSSSSSPHQPYFPEKIEPQSPSLWTSPMCSLFSQMVSLKLWIRADPAYRDRKLNGYGGLVALVAEGCPYLNILVYVI